MIGELTFSRYWLHCKRCGEGYAPFDKEIGIDNEHKITKNLIITICDFGQISGSYEEASKLLDKCLDVNVAPATIKKICYESQLPPTEVRGMQASELTSLSLRAEGQGEDRTTLSMS